MGCLLTTVFGTHDQILTQISPQSSLEMVREAEVTEDQRMTHCGNVMGGEHRECLQGGRGSS